MKRDLFVDIVDVCQDLIHGLIRDPIEGKFFVHERTDRIDFCISPRSSREFIQKHINASDLCIQIALDIIAFRRLLCFTDGDHFLFIRRRSLRILDQQSSGGIGDVTLFTNGDVVVYLCAGVFAHAAVLKDQILLLLL